jgi:hypothetical protein
MSTLATLAERLVAGPAKVRQAIRGVTAEQARARPIPGKWSILEVQVSRIFEDSAGQNFVGFRAGFGQT